MFSSADWSIYRYVKVKSFPTLQFTGLNSLWGLEAVNLTNDRILFVDLFTWLQLTCLVLMGNILLVYAMYSVVIYTCKNRRENFKIVSIDSSLNV